MADNGRWRSLVAIASIAIMALLPGVAAAHLQPGNSVDTSTTPPEIRWTQASTYDGARAWAIDRWNGLNPVNILPDNSSTVNDLEFHDDTSDTGLCGRWWPQPFADDIKFYTPAMNNLTQAKRDACATHEVGHALSLDHNSDGNKDQIMDPNPVSSNPTWTRYPQNHDKADYHSKWGY